MTVPVWGGNLFTPVFHFVGWRPAVVSISPSSNIHLISHRFLRTAVFTKEHYRTATAGECTEA